MVVRFGINKKVKGFCWYSNSNFKENFFDLFLNSSKRVGRARLQKIIDAHIKLTQNEVIKNRKGLLSPKNPVLYKFIIETLDGDNITEVKTLFYIKNGVDWQLLSKGIKEYNDNDKTLINM